jgi:hypothetical protein
MAAAWPYCDAVVSAHNFEALGDLLAAPRAGRDSGAFPRNRHPASQITSTLL